jgi:hypothetical protein
MPILHEPLQKTGAKAFPAHAFTLEFLNIDNWGGRGTCIQKNDNPDLPGPVTIQLIKYQIQQASHP